MILHGWAHLMILLVCFIEMKCLCFPDSGETYSESNSPERVHCHGLWKALDWATKPLFKQDSEREVNTHLILYTRVNRRGTNLRAAGSLEGILNINRRIYIIVHGFLTDAQAEWVVDLAHALLDTEDADVLAVDWGGGANTWRYWKAVANARVASAAVAKMLQEVKGLTSQQVHCIGHSLGAHVCSFMAKECGRFGRVTALDPAQPCFRPRDKNMQLGKQDARFVDVIHTSGQSLRRLGLGLPEPIGHVDFYLNGGKSQPGCSESNSTIPSLIQSIVCSHGRAYLFFVESVAKQNCSFWGHLWDLKEGSVKETLSKPCTLDTCMEMGLRADLYPAKGSFYVNTAEQSPFCVPKPEVDTEMARLLNRSLSALPTT